MQVTDEMVSAAREAVERSAKTSLNLDAMLRAAIQAALDAQPEITVDGIEGPGIHDATGQLPAEVHLRGYTTRQDVDPQTIGGNDGGR